MVFFKEKKFHLVSIGFTGLYMHVSQDKGLKVSHFLYSMFVLS